MVYAFVVIHVLFPIMQPTDLSILLEWGNWCNIQLIAMGMAEMYLNPFKSTIHTALNDSLSLFSADVHKLVFYVLNISGLMKLKFQGFLLQV